MLILNPDSGILGLERHCFQYLIPFLMGILRGVDVSIIAPINGQTMFRQGTQPPLLPRTSTLATWLIWPCSIILYHTTQYYAILPHLQSVTPISFAFCHGRQVFQPYLSPKKNLFENSIMLLFGVSKFCVISFAVFDILFRLGWSLGECCMNLACFYTT